MCYPFEKSLISKNKLNYPPFAARDLTNIQVKITAREIKYFILLVQFGRW